MPIIQVRLLYGWVLLFSIYFDFLTGTKADLKSLNLYNSYLTDGAQNFTQKNENEIIHTIILKKAKTTTAPTDPTRQDDQVIIQFGAPDPVIYFFFRIFIIPMGMIKFSMNY